MKPLKDSRILIALSAALILAAAGCSKKTVAQTPPPAPQPAVRTAPAPQQRAATPRTAPSTQGNMANNTRSNTPDAKTRARIDELLARISDAYFDYNQHTLRPDAIKALQSDSAELRDIISQYPSEKLTIEGHADERGSEAFNLALGDARAKAAKDYLVQVGISSNQLAVVSYGKDKPICDEHDEACWQKNRRIHITASSN